MNAFIAKKAKNTDMKEKLLYSIVSYIPTMAITTIQISKDLLETLKSRKMYAKESYEDIIRDLLEDTMELSDQTRAQIEKSEADRQAGRVYSLEEVKKELGL